MKLKKLELFGFKSFSEPTELIFHEGITAIVGPNGCGKSNIIDAIRWVMGETSAKGLRGDSMEDVIFSGSEVRKALNLCEVTLTLAEVEGHLPEKFGTFHEVAITRRLHRSGESEYLINKVPCRLKDITELFMDTGVGRRAYSVVEQGRIDAILAAKPKDRRFLIEEAAGITKYRSRREETVRKMEHTAQNLQRLGDVIVEVRREMNILKRQAARAEAFKGLRTERRALERDLLVAAWLDLQGRLDEARRSLDEVDVGLAAARAKSARLESAVEHGRLQLLDEERALEARQQGVYHLRNQISQREGRTQFLEGESRSLAARAERAAAEAAELGERREQLAGEVAAVSGELREVAVRLEAGAAALVSLRDTVQDRANNLFGLEASLEKEKGASLTILGDLTRNGHALEHSGRQRADAVRRLEGMGRQGAEVAGKLRELAEEISAREEDLTEAERAREVAGQDRARVDGQAKEVRTQRQGLGARVEVERRVLQTEQSRLKGLEQIRESLELYGAGVKAVLADAKRSGKNGVHGVVADTISAPAEYESALEAALGERLQFVIVEDPSRGLEAVRHLKEKQAGRSSFAPVNLREPEAAVFPTVGESWARGPLLDLVQVAPEYRSVARCLLGDVFVVETLEHALNLWERNGIRATLVTLDGETISAEGVICGGSGGTQAPGLLRRNREIRELQQSVVRREAEVLGLERELEALDRHAEDLGSRLESAREEVHRCELRVVHVAKDLAQLRERQERLEERRDAMEFEREELTTGLERLETEVASLTGERKTLLTRQEDADARREELEGQVEGARAGIATLREELTRRQVEEATDQQRRAGLAERLRTLEVSAENVGRRIEKLVEESRECETQRRERAEELQRVTREIEVLRAELLRQETDTAELARRLDERRGGVTEEERAAAQGRREVDALQKQSNEAELGLRDLELRGENLAERFRERQGGNLGEEGRRGLADGFDPSRAEARVRELGAQLEGFGEINLLAIEEYEERRERFEFLESQRRDLEESLASLRQAIQRINRVSRERFAETFEKVSQTFQELYPQLFRGGEARLVLTDPEDMLETGIDIVARPPGKKPQHISLLSGGEKALTAVALIFSIFLVKPSPFCILDEVDAPLDEANIGRFCEMIRGHANASQFLLITHNKSTMEVADHLYGVTMGDPGVSRAVSVRLAMDPRAEAA
jgi:chromosome segregation protein